MKSKLYFALFLLSIPCGWAVVAHPEYFRLGACCALIVIVYQLARLAVWPPRPTKTGKGWSYYGAE
jgi:4-hydroxybenzoate polyprenyltransferase